jgi:ubiquinone/menaquinone biosynthesis C-methylase UbiE
MKDIVKIYDRVAPEISQVYEEQSHAKGIKEFVDRLSPETKILDLGCGNGKDVSMFSGLGFETIGIDASAGMVRQAGKRYPRERIFQMDARKLKYPNNSFDAVWSWSVLTHFNYEDKRKVLREINRVLRGRGFFTQMIWKGRGVFVNQHVYPRSHYLLTVPSWKKIYKEAGFAEPILKDVRGKRRNFVRLTARKHKNMLA